MRSRRTTSSARTSRRRAGWASVSSSSAYGWSRELTGRFSPMSAPPYLKFAGPVLDEATIAGVDDVLRSGHIASGPWVRRFEDSLSEFCGGRPVRVLTSATAAVEVALQLAGIGPGRRGDHLRAELLHRPQHDRQGRREAGVRRLRSRDAQSRPRRGRSGDHAAHARDHADVLAGLASRPRSPPCARPQRASCA